MDHQYLYFDHASTTPCCEEALRRLELFAQDEYGNPSSAHARGQSPAQGIREARLYFASLFRVSPEQVIFTGSGTEANNLAIYGSALNFLAKKLQHPSTPAARIVVSAAEHPAVKKTALSLTTLGFDVQLAPMTLNGQIQTSAFESLLTPETFLVSVMRVNNITGTALPVDSLSELVRDRVPSAIFHTDAIQAFGKVDLPVAPSTVDLISLSAHKIEGPKGIGALIALNPKLVQSGSSQALRPIIWGGGQEHGMRSGTQSAGLISGFHHAAKRAIEKKSLFLEQVTKLQSRLKSELVSQNLLSEQGGPIHWNSPASNVVPYIVSLSIPGYPPGPLTRFLEQRGCLVATGSACSSAKSEPDAVLQAMGLPLNICQSAIRISLSDRNIPAEIDQLVRALGESIDAMNRLMRPSRKH